MTRKVNGDNRHSKRDESNHLRRSARQDLIDNRNDRAERSLNRALKIETENELKRSDTLYLLGLVQLRRKRDREGVLSFVNSCSDFYNWEVHREREGKREIDLLSEVQNLPAYQHLTGLCGISPTRLIRYMSRQVGEGSFVERALTTLQYARELKCDGIILAKRGIERKLVEKQMSVYDSIGGVLYYGKLLFYEARSILTRFPEYERLLLGIEKMFLSLCEDFRFSITDNYVNRTPAHWYLSKRFAADSEFLDYVGTKSRNYLSESVKRQAHDPFLSMAAFYSGNPVQHYSRLFAQNPDISHGITTKTGQTPVAPSYVDPEKLQKRKKLAGLKKKIHENRQKDDEYLLQSRRVEKSRNQLIVLRRWNSVTPKIPGKKPKSLGGGFFLIWNGRGIVVDPGYDFLDNMKEVGFSINDIDLILVTHAHDDHTADIEPIYSLDYKAGKTLRRHLDDRKTSTDTKDSHYRDLVQLRGQRFERGIPLIGSEGSLIKYSQLIKNSWSVGIPLTEISDSARIEAMLDTFGIAVSWIRAEHNEMPWMQTHTSMSYLIELKDETEPIRIGFTGDTRESRKLPSLMSDCDLIILNLGSFLDISSDHLGEHGAGRLLWKALPKLAIVTEFGEELDEIRDEVTDEVIELMMDGLRMIPGSTEPVVLPGDIDFRVYLDYPGFEVEGDGLTRPVPPGQVGYRDPGRGRTWRGRGIQYFMKPSA